MGAHSLWLDEGATWSWATAPTWHDTLFAEANHPPLWWLVTRAWIAMFGQSEAALRAPAALLGVLGVFLAWRVARRLLIPSQMPRRGGFGSSSPEASPPASPPDAGARGPRARQTACWVAGFAALSPFLAEFGQEARMYAALVAEALGLALCYLAWLDTKRRRWLAAYAVLGAMTLHTHYFGLWPVLASPLHALWLSRRTAGLAGGARVRAMPMILATGIAGLLFVPWALYFASHYRGIASEAAYEPFSKMGYVLWRMAVGPGIVVMDRTRATEGLGRVLAEEWPFIAITAAIWGTALILGTRALLRRPGTRSFVLFQLLVPLVAVLACSTGGYRLIHERYLVMVAPWLFLVAVLSAREGPPSWRPALAVGLALLLAAGLVGYHGASVVLHPHGKRGALDGRNIPARWGASTTDSLRALHHGHPYGKEPWRDTQRALAAHLDPAKGDVLVVYPHYLHLVFDFYDRGRLPQIRLRIGDTDAQWASALETQRALLGKAQRVGFLTYGEEGDDVERARRLTRQHIMRAWTASGMGRWQEIGPTHFDRSWGTRVTLFNRAREDRP